MGREQNSELDISKEIPSRPKAACGQRPDELDLGICPVRLQEAAALLERGSEEHRALAGELMELAKRLQGHPRG